MRPLKEALSTSLHWIQAGDLESQLIEEDSTIPFATLVWAKRWGILATGETTDGNWTFKRVGFLHPKVTVREVDSKSEVAVFTITWAGDGVLEIHSDGKKFVFKRTSMWHSEWILKRSDSDEILLTIKPDLGLTKVVTQRKIGAEVELGPGAIREPRLSLIALVTWYVIILMTYDDYSSYASGITAAVTAATI